MATIINYPTTPQNPITRGDTFDEQFFTFKKNGAAVDITDYVLQGQIRYLSKTGKVYHEMTIGNGITVTDAEQGEFTVHEFDMDWPAGMYYWDIEFISPDGIKKTYFKATIDITQDVTNIVPATPTV
jgi:Na+-transporting NADH:ubiquinone oxidoreductase subunit NqrA